jgi:hypothetical protein
VSRLKPCRRCRMRDRLGRKRSSRSALESECPPPDFRGWALLLLEPSGGLRPAAPGQPRAPRAASRRARGLVARASTHGRPDGGTPRRPCRPTATSQPKNAAPQFVPPYLSRWRSRTSPARNQPCNGVGLRSNNCLGESIRGNWWTARSHHALSRWGQMGSRDS